MCQGITDSVLSFNLNPRNTMIPKIEISSLSVNRLNRGAPFDKYQIDVSIDEVEGNELGIKLKYKFVILSNPTNAKISIEGVTSISGDENETSKYLKPDEKNVPQIVNIVYQELLPLLYVLTKSIDITCPAYKISQISQTPTTQTDIPQQVQEPKIQVTQVSEPDKEEQAEINPLQASSEQLDSHEEPEILDELEKLVEEQRVS